MARAGEHHDNSTRPQERGNIMCNDNTDNVTATDEPELVEILFSRVDELTSRVDKLNRRAIKLGLEPLTVETSGLRTRSTTSRRART
jgi:hypothetical protein